MPQVLPNGHSNSFLDFEESERSKILPNAVFGYWKVTVECPPGLRGIDHERAYTAKEIKVLKDKAER